MKKKFHAHIQMLSLSAKTTTNNNNCVPQMVKTFINYWSNSMAFFLTGSSFYLLR